MQLQGIHNRARPQAKHRSDRHSFRLVIGQAKLAGVERRRAPSICKAFTLQAPQQYELVPSRSLRMSRYSHGLVTRHPARSAAAAFLGVLLLAAGCIALFLLVAGLAEHQDRARDLVLLVLLALAPFAGLRLIDRRNSL